MPVQNRYKSIRGILTDAKRGNTRRIFRLKGVRQMSLGSVFLGSGQNFTTVGRSPEIWGNFSKICIKIIKNMKNYG